MSRDDLENLRSALSSDASALLALLDDDVEWDYVGAFPEAVTYHGPREVGEFLSQWAAGFEDFGLEADGLIDAGDSVVVCLHQWGRGTQTGAQAESRTWQVFNFRGGKIIRCRGYATKEEASAAA